MTARSDWVAAASDRERPERALPTSLGTTTLKRGLLAFWAIWLSIVVLTNLLDALKALGALPAGWSFASGNWELMLKTTAIHGTPTWLTALLYLGVIAWEASAAALFWQAFARAARG